MKRDKVGGVLPPIQIADFEPFYERKGDIWVPYHSLMSAGTHLHYMSPEVAWKGVYAAMRALGGAVVPFAKLLRDAQEKAAAGH